MDAAPDDQHADLGPFNDGLDYPMYVVTAAAGEQRSGCLVGFGSQVSIDPPRWLVCISVVNHTHPVAEAADVLAVHLLDRPGYECSRRTYQHIAGDRAAGQPGLQRRQLGQVGPQPVHLPVSRHQRTHRNLQ